MGESLQRWSARLGTLAWKWSAFLCRIGPRAYLAGKWPLPGSKPWQQSQIRIYSRGGGLGDELMATVAFRAIKAANPRCAIEFATRRPELFAGHPDLDSVILFGPGTKDTHLSLVYDRFLPPPRPLSVLMAESVGLRIPPGNVTMPHLERAGALPPFEIGLPGPLVVLQPFASQWTPNKQWPVDYWRELISGLCEHVSVMEVGHESIMPEGWSHSGFRSVTGKTEIPELFSIVRQAALFIGPPSGGMHVANAFGVRSLILFGGYESPAGYGYANVVPFYNAVECAPCWLSDGCPYGLKCLKGISPARVLETALAELKAPSRA